MGLPWSHLEQLIEDVHVREVAFGTGYIVTGQAPPRPPVLAGDPAGSGRRSTWAVPGRHAQHAGAAGLDRAARLELQDIDPGAAADYLTRTQLDSPPDGWQELTSRLRQDLGSSLAQAPSNPLMLTLVRDTYRAGDNAGELLGLRDAAGHPASGEDIAGHLLDRVLPAAHTQQPGEPPPRYDLPTAERALRRIATRMNNDGTPDLQWWHVPAWAPAAPRVMATWLGAVLVVVLVAGLASGHTDGLLAGNTAGFWAVFAFGRGNKPPQTNSARAMAATVPAQAAWWWASSPGSWSASWSASGAGSCPGSCIRSRGHPPSRLHSSPSDRTPVRLMRFLEDACSRSVLRTVGPVYQFRDARPQDRLAIQEPRPARLVWQALSQEADHQSVSPLARRRAEHPVRRASADGRRDSRCRA